MNQPSPVGPPAASLNLIRGSLVLAVGGLAAVAILKHREGGAEAVYSLVAAAMAVAAVFVVFVLRQGATGKPRAQAITFMIIGWAVGEGAAFFGWVLHLIGMPLPWALPGTLAFIVALAALPIPPDDLP